MNTVWPLRFRDTAGRLLFASEAGGWFLSGEEFLDRYASGGLTSEDHAFLADRGFSFAREGDLAHSAFLRHWAGRHARRADDIGYVILVPTLRCNLSCGYCQVSRASEHARGYDWTEETLAQVLAFLDGLSSPSPKIEFQGGEPLLRVDLLRAVRTFCRNRFKSPTFVVCTNMQTLDANAWDFLDAGDTHVSTSIDGDVATHTRQRTGTASKTAEFVANVEQFIDRFGNDRISALPTIDLARPFDPVSLVETYSQYGVTSIYLRPVNRQGFARRTAPTHGEVEKWSAIHESFVRHLIHRNFRDGTSFEEFYFTHALRRVLRTGIDNHVDLRNPNLLADSYLVIDHDGVFYPTDEARMISRVGHIDLSIGKVGRGLDREKIAALNAWSFNDLDPDCQHCVYQPFCGTDVVDDVSRYGRIDVPRHDTWFCRRHLALYDLIFGLLSDPHPEVKHSLALWAGVTEWPSDVIEVHA